MATKPNALEKRIDEIEKFVAERITQYPAFTSIHQVLIELKTSFTLNQLSLQIISQDAESAQMLQKLLNDQPSLKKQYTFKTTVVSNVSDSESISATLVFKNSDTLITYDLVTTQTYSIGRNPQKVQVLLADPLSLVGGCHAEFQFSSNRQWQIRDLNSRNGTYVNNCKITDWHELETGDQICLGSQSASDGSVTLTFNASASVVTQSALDCNVVCLIVNLDHFLSKTIQETIEQTNHAGVMKLFILAITPANTAPEVAKQHFFEMERWVSTQSNNTLINLVPMVLQPIISNPKATVLLPQAQPEFEEICQSLEALAQERVEELIIQRVVTQLHHQIDAIETILNQQQISLSRKIQQDELRLEKMGKTNLKEQSKRASDTVKKEIDQFFRQVKNEISLSKSDLLSEHRTNSLIHKIKKCIKRLKHVSVQENGLCHLHFQTKHGDKNIHAVISYLYEVELKAWTLAEWKRIHTLYNADGFIGLLRSSYRTLNFIPNLELSVEQFHLPRNIEVDQILQISTVSADCKMHYKQLTFRGFIYKRLKSEVITLLSLIAMIGVPFFTFINLPFDKARYTLLIIPFVVFMMYSSYQQEKATKLEETIEKLQKELLDHYQPFVKNLAERLVQHLMFAMEAEERRLENILETVREQHSTHIAELEKNQIQIRAQLEDTKKIQQRALEKEVVEFQKLKRDISILAKL